MDILAKHLGDVTGINIAGIHVDDLHGAAGMNNGNGILILDYRDIMNPSRLGELLDTVIHEARHQFQRDAIDNPEKFGISRETLDRWIANFNDYISPEDDPEGYMNQIVEADARLAAGRALELFQTSLQQA